MSISWTDKENNKTNATTETINDNFVDEEQYAISACEPLTIIGKIKWLTTYVESDSSLSQVTWNTNLTGKMLLEHVLFYDCKINIYSLNAAIRKPISVKGLRDQIFELNWSSHALHSTCQHTSGAPFRCPSFVSHTLLPDRDG